jgi:hypothetical protein
MKLLFRSPPPCFHGHRLLAPSDEAPPITHCKINNRQGITIWSTRVSVQSSELGPPNPHPASECGFPPLGPNVILLDRTFKETQNSPARKKLPHAAKETSFHLKRQKILSLNGSKKILVSCQYTFFPVLKRFGKKIREFRTFFYSIKYCIVYLHRYCICT